MSSRSSRTLYVGNLPGDVREREVEDLFYKYGPVAHIDLKIPPRPPDAIRGRDGYDFGGQRLRVELAHGGRGRSSSDRHSSYGGGHGRGPSKRSEYRVLVTGLPSSASWQDLKDHMRRAGDVCFSQVFRDGGGTTGIVDYTNYDDMKYAIKKLDDSEFRNAFSRAYVRSTKTTQFLDKTSLAQNIQCCHNKNSITSRPVTRSYANAHNILVSETSVMGDTEQLSTRLSEFMEQRSTRQRALEEQMAELSHSIKTGKGYSEKNIEGDESSAGKKGTSTSQ
ncbi:hypothetical protein V6N11_001321 [Hibiscus sabdariffa]|uniref:RRM domain-containing protein n=1 Tax=Hibiscus sabdariffa TaxID=183260 RepID=A0ABR2RZC3_9ROSI